MLRPANELVRTLRLQSNTSVTTRAKLDHLLEVTGSIWDMLMQIREDVRGLGKVADSDEQVARLRREFEDE